MDNASYHNVISPEDKVPKMSMKKDTIIAWLLKHGIDHHSAKTKADLIELVNASEVSKSEVFSIDKFFKAKWSCSSPTSPIYTTTKPHRIDMGRNEKKSS